MRPPLIYKDVKTWPVRCTSLLSKSLNLETENPAVVEYACTLTLSPGPVQSCSGGRVARFVHRLSKFKGKIRACKMNFHTSGTTLRI